MESPYRFVMSPSKSAPDMTVSSLVDRFNTLEVKDRDEEKSAKMIKRLESALRRAEMAREEAETEAMTLRNEMKDAAEEREGERDVLRARLEEYEVWQFFNYSVKYDEKVRRLLENHETNCLRRQKKYEKAKDRFRQQRVRHEESMRKAATEFMEREKQHWRQTAAVEEELAWERKVRADAHDLLAFLEMERHCVMQSARSRTLHPRQKERSVVRKPSLAPVVNEAIVKQAEVVVVVAVEEEKMVAGEENRELAVIEVMEDATPSESMQEDPSSPTQNTTIEAQPDTAPEDPAPSSESSIPEEEPSSETLISPEEESADEGHKQESTPLQQITTPKRNPLQPTLIPINFNDDDDDENNSPSSDKENSFPPPTTTATPAKKPAAYRSISLRTPSRQISAPNPLNAPATAPPNANDSSNTSTSGDYSALLGKGEVIDRAAALAAIQYRRGRAQSFLNAGQMTPKRLGVLEGVVRRDVSAPPLVTMSVGRKNMKV